ncbi:hypothetical protein FF098_010290 [Parvularcula flava]|uniref:Lipoprotein n=2 Tax=Aquisalinus luteolus TaxID=1566827 RepID=A0A8J3A2G6_9PROT|nr:hypothetical protein [Aquisalinus luteolus]GGH98045.1 hypothetical protein GCM10011355_20710 [Aquisalinus luteolus]
MDIFRTALSSAIGLLCLSACAASPYGYDYRQAQRIECAATAGSVIAANNMADDFERAAGRDIDAYEDFDRETLWTSLAVAGVSAILSGRVPDGDDACAGINSAGDLVYSRY